LRRIWPRARASESPVAVRYGVRGIPTVMMIDGESRVVRRATFLTASAMIDFLKQGSAGD
jgi:hypothetical protein